MTHSLTSFIYLLTSGFITEAFSNYPGQVGNSFGPAQMGMPRSKERSPLSEVTHEAVALQTVTWLSQPLISPLTTDLCDQEVCPSTHPAYRVDLSNFCHIRAV